MRRSTLLLFGLFLVLIVLGSGIVLGDIIDPVYCSGGCPVDCYGCECTNFNGEICTSYGCIHDLKYCYVPSDPTEPTLTPENSPLVPEQCTDACSSYSYNECPLSCCAAIVWIHNGLPTGDGCRYDPCVFSTATEECRGDDVITCSNEIINKLNAGFGLIYFVPDGWTPPFSWHKIICSDEEYCLAGNCENLLPDPVCGNEIVENPPEVCDENTIIPPDTVYLQQEVCFNDCSGYVPNYCGDGEIYSKIVPGGCTIGERICYWSWGVCPMSSRDEWHTTTWCYTEKCYICQGNYLQIEECDTNGDKYGNAIPFGDCTGDAGSTCTYCNATSCRLAEKTIPWETTCTDSDDGPNYFIQGTVNWFVDETSNGLERDSCSGNTLTEWSCNAALEKEYWEEVCALGCSNGACVCDCDDKSQCAYQRTGYTGGEIRPERNDWPTRIDDVNINDCTDDSSECVKL